MERISDDRLLLLYKIENFKRETVHEEWLDKKGKIVGEFTIGTTLQFLTTDNVFIETSTIADFCITASGYMVETQNSCYYFTDKM